MLGSGVTLHLSIPEVIVVGLVLALAGIREVLHLVRANGDELLDFLRWWQAFRGEFARIRSSRALPGDSQITNPRI